MEADSNDEALKRRINLLDFLNQHVILLKVILTIGTTAATIILLYYNFRTNQIASKTLKQLKGAREKEFCPYLILEVVFASRYNDMVINLVIKNNGKSPAHDIQLNIDQDLSIWNSLISEEKFTFKDMTMSQMIEMLPPGDHYSEWLDRMDLFFKNNETPRLTGNLQYKDEAGNSYEFPVDINLEPYKYRVTMRDKGWVDLAQTLDNFKRELSTANMMRPR